MCEKERKWNFRPKQKLANDVVEGIEVTGIGFAY
jgi:hypothetical protein